MPSSRVTESASRPKTDFHCPFMPVTTPMRCLRPLWACYQAQCASLLNSRTWRAWPDLQHLLQPLMPALWGLLAVDKAVLSNLQALQAGYVVVGAGRLAVPKATTLVAGSPGAPANEIQTSVCT